MGDAHKARVHAKALNDRLAKAGEKENGKEGAEGGSEMSVRAAVFCAVLFCFVLCWAFLVVVLWSCVHRTPTGSAGAHPKANNKPTIHHIKPPNTPNSPKNQRQK